MIHTDGTPTIANGAGDYDPDLPYDAETQRIKRERSAVADAILEGKELAKDIPALADDKLHVVTPGHSWFTGAQPPEIEGYVCVFVAHYGTERTVWTYERS